MVGWEGKVWDVVEADVKEAVYLLTKNALAILRVCCTVQSCSALLAPIAVAVPVEQTG